MATGNLDAANLAAVARGGLIHEDVLRQIFDISAIPLPFTDRISSDNVRNQYTSWTTDVLAPPTINEKFDGQDTNTINDTRTGARVGNHCTISLKVLQVSTRAREVDTIGRSDELSYQLMKRSQELRRDIEMMSLLNRASLADTGTAAGQVGGFHAWLKTSTSRGATGADGGFNPATGVVDAATPGTGRALTETLVRDIAQSVYMQGGDPTVAMSTPTVIRRLSEYMFTESSRIATLRSEAGQSRESLTAKGSVNVFVTDFGVTMEMQSNRLMAEDDAGNNNTLFIYDPQYVRHGFLHGYRVENLAKTGLADRRQLAVDWTLKPTAEVAHGLIADIDPTVPVTQA